MKNGSAESVGYFLGVAIVVAGVGLLLGMVVTGLVRLAQWVLA